MASAACGGAAPPQAQPPPGQVEFLVSVPLGTQPGTMIQTTTPDAQVLTFAVPADFADGQMIPVYYTPLQQPVGRQPSAEIGVEPPPQAGPSKSDVRALCRTFADAKDRWKIDGGTLKGFYLHSQSGYLYTWDQAKGMLYEYQQSTGQCQAVWTAKVPSLNAEIWKVLPLPPTDPAALLQAQAQTGVAPSLDVYLVLTVAHEKGSHLPKDVLQSACKEFCSRFELNEEAREKLGELPPAGQHFVIQNFRSQEGRLGEKASRRLVSYVEKIRKRPSSPWGNSACTLIVSSSGAIIGRSCPDLDALCRNDPPQRLAQAHCKIVSEQDRFFMCDLRSSQEGTELDGYLIGEDWAGPLRTGSLVKLGPLLMKIQLSDMAQDSPLPDDTPLKRVLGKEADEGGAWQLKVYQKTAEDEQADKRRRLQDYKDRAELRRERSKCEPGSIAVDTLVQKFGQIQELEKQAEKAEEGRVEMPTMADHREGNMGTDGSFLGMGAGLERAGIGFASEAGFLVPNVLDPKNLSARDSNWLKARERFEQVSK